jgi:hypothetical protein
VAYEETQHARALHPHVVYLSNQVVRQVVALADGAAQHEVATRARRGIAFAERDADEDLAALDGAALARLERLVCLDIRPAHGAGASPRIRIVSCSWSH